MDAASDLLALALLPGLRPAAARTLKERAPLSDVLARPGDHADLLGPEAVGALQSGAVARAAAEERRRAEELGAQIVGRDDDDYPARVRQLYDPPPVLYVMGSLDAGEGERAVAVVGSRRASVQGLAAGRAFGRDLAAAGLTVVSGLARGIDTEAHRGALDAGGRTIAVLGSGLDRVYPAENAGLARTIVGRGGAVISEQPFGRGPLPHHFPQRNRIIAGYGLGAVVVEAAERSGALVTARVALEEGREVFAVPGHPASEQAAGTNALIRDGARLVRCAADVLEDLGLAAPAPRAGAGGDAVLGALRPDAPSSVEEICARSDREPSVALARLSELELEGRVRRLPGALYVRSE